MSILKATSTANRKSHVEISRELTVDDLVIELIKPTKEVGYSCGHVTFSVSGSLKTEVMTEILSALNADTYSGGQFRKHCDPIQQIIKRGGELAEGVIIREDYLKEKFSTSGTRKDKQQSKYDAAVASLEAKAELMNDVARDQIVSTFQKHLNDIIELNNNEHKEFVRSLVVEQNVSTNWFDDNLNTSEKEQISESQTNIDQLDLEISKLQEKVKALKDSQYQVRRTCIEEKLKSTFCEDGKDIIDSFKSETKAETFEHLAFG